jgi:hypothetical protein
MAVISGRTLHWTLHKRELRVPGCPFKDMTAAHTGRLFICYAFTYLSFFWNQVINLSDITLVKEMKIILPASPVKFSITIYTKRLKNKR